MSQKQSRTIGYLRVSTQSQETEKFKDDILRFSNERRFGNVEWVEEIVSGKKNWKERKIKEVIETLGADDKLVVPELSRLGRSTLEVLEILKAAKDKDIAVYAVKEGLEMNGTVQAKVMSTMLSLFAELERDFISQRTKEALRAKKTQGVKLGRPKGPGKSKLDEHKEDIIAHLKSGSTRKYIAKKYNTSEVNLWKWLNKHKLQDLKPEF